MLALNKLIWCLVFLLVLDHTLAITGNKTEYDDGSSNQNITSNTSKYLTILQGVTISEANLTLTGLNVSNWTRVDDGTTYLLIAGGDDGGNPFINFYDNLYSTAAHPTYKSFMDVRVNFSLDYNNTIRLEAKIGAICTDDLSLKNYTLPDDCKDNTIQLKYYVNYNSKYTYIYCRNQSNWELIYQKENDGCDNKYIFEDAMHFETNELYASNVIIKVNNTVVFNHTGNLTTVNDSVNINPSSVLQNCYVKSSQCKIDISADSFGKVELSDLSVAYNRSFTAILDIVAPVQIGGTVTSGTDVSATINISNIGDWNATNLSLETVSAAGTPNLNDSITHNCNDIENGTIESCTVIFNNVLLNPEPDERLRVKAVGSDDNQTIFSDSIDVDFSLGIAGGGGSSGYQGFTKCNWKVWRPTTKIFRVLGWRGYSSYPQKFQIYNNASASQSFSYSIEGLDCKFLKKENTIAGNSLGTNTFMCDFPTLEDNGKIRITGGGCDTTIDVVLKGDSMFGLFFIYLGGAAGGGIAFGLWFVILGGFGTLLYFGSKG